MSTKSFALALACAHALGAALLAGSYSPQAHAQPTPAAPAASAPADVVRADMGPVLNAAQELLKNGKHKEALAKAGEAAAMPNLTVYEAYIIGRIRASAALRAEELPLAVTYMTEVLANPKLPVAERGLILQGLADATYRDKKYAEAAKWTAQYFEAGGTRIELRLLWGQSLYLIDDAKGAIEQLTRVIKEQEAGGAKPEERVLRLLAASSHKANEPASYVAALERLVQLYPTKDYWQDLLSRVERKAGFAERLFLDSLRLRLALGLMKEASDYEDLAELSQKAGFPGEAQAALDDGFKAGLLGKGPDAAKHQKARDAAARRAAEDAKELAQSDAAAARARDGDALARLGFAMFTGGQGAKGLEMMERALARPDLKRGDDTRLMVGYALYQAGQRERAREVLKGVTGTDGAADLARLWILLAGQKT